MVYILSFLLSIGSLTSLISDYLVYITLMLFVIVSLFNRRIINNIIANFHFIYPLIIVLILLLVNTIVNDSVYVEGVSINYKFIATIFLFLFLRSFFIIYPKSVHYSLLFYAIGVMFLVMLYNSNLVAGELEFRNNRLIFFGENPNSLSTRIGLGVILLFWFFKEETFFKRKMYKYVFLIPLPFCILMMIDTASKGSVLILLASIVLLFIFSNITVFKKIIVLFVIGVALVYLFPLFIDTGLYERFKSNSLLTGRNEIWLAAWDIFLNNPLGVGEAGYRSEIVIRLNKIIDTHNVFLYLLVTGGFFAAMSYSVFLFKILKIQLAIFRFNKKPLFLIIFVFLLFLMSKTGGVLTYLVMWYFLAIISMEKKII